MRCVVDVLYPSPSELTCVYSLILNRLFIPEVLGLSNATGLSHDTFFTLSLRHELVALARPNTIVPDTLECTDVLTPHLYVLFFVCPSTSTHCPYHVGTPTMRTGIRRFETRHIS